jgi:hypothetical protein
MCIIYHDGENAAILDLGEEKEGRTISFAEGYAWFTFEGETVKLPVECIDQIIS